MIEATLDICVRCQLPLPGQGTCRLCNLGPGSALGPYRVLHQLGEGSTGRTYACTGSGRAAGVAVKLLAHGPTAERPSLIERFHRDSRLVAQIRHPNLVEVYATGSFSSCPFVVMEQLSASVEDRLRAVGCLEPVIAIGVALDAARGLGAAADRGLLHRDVKPSNLLVDDSFRAKVGDFGIATPAGGPLDGMRRGPLLLGTAAYMSPEQAQGRFVDHRADIYALGITLYRLLTGRLPFPGTSQLAVLVKQVIEPLPPLHPVEPEIAALVSPVLQRMTAKVADDRQPSHAAVTADLEQLASAVAALGLAVTIPA